MYRLENDVEWTDELKNAFKNNVTRAKIVCNGDEIDYDNGLISIELEDSRYVPNVGFIGQAVARKLTIYLLDTDKTKNLENKEVTLYIGADYNGDTYYINYGNFIVNAPPENDSTNGNVKIVAFDYMIMFNKPYINQVSYPCTLKQLLENICSQAGVELGQEHFANENFIVENNQFENATLREILQNIGKCAFSWARIGQDNKLYLDFEISNTITETFTIDSYYKDKYKKANEYYGAVNKVTYGQSDITGQEESVSNQADIDLNGLKELIINDNYFAYTTAKRHELIQAGTRLLGLRYMPIQQFETIGTIYLDCNDVIEIEDDEENSITTRVFSHIIKYNGASTDSITTEAQSLNEQVYKNRNTIPAQNSRTELMVDRANKMITSTVETVTEQNTKISQIQQTVDELNSKISDIADVTVMQETNTGNLSFTDINASEPIHIEIRATGQNISYLYPFATNFYPANNLYITLRTLRFKNITTNEVFDYILPNDLLYYDSTHYDELILDYGSGGDTQTVYVNKKCKYNENTGTVETLSQEQVLEYEFPYIPLTDGDYTVQMLKYDNTVYPCYLQVRLMAKNIYTTQFATRSEVHTEINQTATSIDLSVDQKLSNYSTTTQMNSAINLKANQITSQVSETYATKTTTNTLSSRISQTAKSIALTVNNGSTSSGITITTTKEDGTTSTASGTITMNGLVKFTDLSTSGSTTINGSNITTGQINANLITTGNLNANRINGGTISGSSINLGNGTFTVTTGGAMKATGAEISGKVTATAGAIASFVIDGYRLKASNSKVGMSSATYDGAPSFWAGYGDPYETEGWGNKIPFYVTNQGYLKATNANISGTITATSGTFQNCTVTNTCNIPASAVKSGTFSTDRIPNLSADKITTGTLSGVTIDTGSITSSATIKGETLEGTSYVSVRLNSEPYGYTIGNATGKYGSFWAMTGWSSSGPGYITFKGRNVTFSGGIITSIGGETTATVYF